MAHLDPRLTSQLQALLTEGGKAIADPFEAEPFLTDWRRRFMAEVGAIAVPASVAEVQAVVCFCHENGLSITPQGGNTGMCGGASPRSQCTVLLNLSRLKRIRQISIEGRYVIADAGVTVHEINEAVRDEGLCLPIEFGARESASIGGVISTNAGGMNVLRYGSAREQVLGLEVVLVNGDIWDGLRALRKDNSGPDLKHLFIGTEGTFGIVTGAVLRLAPLETHSASILLQARNMDDIISLASLAQREGGERLSSFELLSGFALREGARRVLGIAPPLGGGGEWYALARFAAGTPVDGLAASFAEAAFRAGLAIDGTVPGSLAQEEEIWRIRDCMSELHRYLGPSLRFDLAVPVDRLNDLVARLHAYVGENLPDCDILCFGHMGDGNLHFSICSTDGRLPGAAAGIDVSDEIHHIAWNLGGTISAEHGIGQLHVGELAQQKPAIELALARSLKQTLDPRGILNPGVIFPVQNKENR